VDHKNLDLQIFNCDKCSEAKKYRAYPMPGFYGSNCFNNVAIIAQNPGLPNEVQKQKTFTFDEIEQDYIEGVFKAPIGDFLNTLLDMHVQDIFYSNVVKCAFPSGYQLNSEVDNCKEYLKSQLEIVKPRIVICIGALALHYFLPGVNLAKYSLKTIYSTSWKIFPIYHPAYLSRFSDITRKEYLSHATEKLKELLDEKQAVSK